MKKGINIIAFMVLVTMSIVSCNDGFLDRIPLDAVSEESYFNTATDLQTYVNSFYNTLPKYHFQHGGDNLGLDETSDLMVSADANNPAIISSFDQKSSSGLAPITNSTWDNNYTNIRNANYFLSNYYRVKSRDNSSNHFIGEGYFWRAWFYYNLLVSFGDVPVILNPLNIDDNEELYRPRDSRNEVAKQIIQDLDSAIVNLQWKGNGEASSGRINKETAIVMKARVALFEGTWEHYHGVNGTEFQVSGKDGAEFLNLIESTVQELIEHQGATISIKGGLFNEPYNQLFAQEDGETTDGVFWYRVYILEMLDGGHDFYNKISDATYRGITKRLVDMYLDVDGKPQVLSSKPLTTLDEMGQNLDPRFRQTIWTPNRGPLNQIQGRTSWFDLSFRYPVLVPGVLEGWIPTGFRNWKGAIFNASEFRAGSTDDILIRYAEGLLALAEAKAILGTITQADIDKTINVLRGRIGMKPMILSEVNSWNNIYDTSAGFDLSSPNIVNEIRRERTVELALEGFRLTDIKRWAVFDKVINGYKPKGARLQEFIDYFNDPAALENDGWEGTANVAIIKGNNCDTDADGIINPFFKSTQFQEGGDGYWINKDRDYLGGIPISEIELYEQYGVTLTQNPGWH